MADHLEILSAAREGELAPIEEFFKQENATELFKSIKNEYSLATPLHMAAANAHVDVLKYTLHHLDENERANIVNQKNDSGNTALHWAALTGSLESAQLLVGAGADAKIKNQAGFDSIYQAEVAENEALVEYFLKTVDFEDEEEETISAGIPEEETKEKDV